MARRAPKVLLLERNPGLRDLLSEALADLGFEVSAGGSRRDGLELMVADPEPDLLLLDLVDEGSGGRALLAFLGDQPETARIPVVVMTDASWPPGLPARATPLVKPFGLDELAAAAHLALGSWPRARADELHGSAP